jgi:hypothetical protein
MMRIPTSFSVSATTYRFFAAFRFRFRFDIRPFEYSQPASGRYSVVKDPRIDMIHARQEQIRPLIEMRLPAHGRQNA